MWAVSVSDAGVLGGLSHEAGVASTNVSLADRLTRGLAEGLHVAPMRGIELVERCRVEWDARTEEQTEDTPDLPSAGVGRDRNVDPGRSDAPERVAVWIVMAGLATTSSSGAEAGGLPRRT